MNERMNKNDEAYLGPDMFNFGLHKASFLWFHVAVPVLPTAIDNSTVDTFQHIPATPEQHHNYTVNQKKRDILFLTNLDQFLYFLYHFNREEILHATIVKFTTSTYLCAHLTS